MELEIVHIVRILRKVGFHHHNAIIAPHHRLDPSLLARGVNPLGNTVNGQGVVVVTNVPNLTTGRASILNLDAAIQIRGMSKMESLKNQQPHVAQLVVLCES